MTQVLQTVPIIQPDNERLARILLGQEPLRVVSYGVGTHSTAMLVKLMQDGQRPDLVLFADTGDELQETYAARDFYKKWCEDNGIEFQTVFNKYGKPLGQYCIEKKIIPSRKKRDCTTKFKIAAMNRYLRDRYGKKAKFLKYIGYDCKERERAWKATFRYVKLSPALKVIVGFKSPGYEKLTFPLIDWEMDRYGCAKMLLSLNLPVPQKSGCKFCIFTKKFGWVWLYFKHPDDFWYAVFMEENSREFHKVGKGHVALYGTKGLRHLAKWIEENRAELEAKFNAMGDSMAEKAACEFARGINKGSGI